MSGYCDRCGNTLCVCSEHEAQTAVDQLVDEWRWGYIHGYLHGWSDRVAGRQYGEGRYLRRPNVPPPNDGSRP